MVKHQSDNLRLLKFIVHFMGFLLIAGIILLFFLAFQRNQEKNLTNKQECREAEDIMPDAVTGKVLSASYENDALTVVLEDSSQIQNILVMDPCTHNILHKVRIRPYPIGKIPIKP